MVTSLSNDDCSSFILALQSSCMGNLVGEIIFLNSGKVIHCGVESLMQATNKKESALLFTLQWTEEWYSVFTGKMTLGENIVQLSGKLYSNYSSTFVDFETSAERTLQTMLFDFEIDSSLLYPEDMNRLTNIRSN